MAKVTEPLDQFRKAKVTDFLPDTKNANKGTVRGAAMIDSSIREDGAARSIVVDADNNVVAGNKTLEAMVNAGINDAIVVETTGNELVVVKRKDWKLYEQEAPRRYAYRDNRAGELSLDWDPLQVVEDLQAGLDLSSLWYPEELNAILEAAGTELLGGNGQGQDPPEVTETEAERLAKEYGVQPGQVWQLGRHKIACVDSTDEETVKGLIGGDTVGMVWADPPYGINEETNRHEKKRGKLTASIDWAPIIGDDKPFNPEFILSLNAPSVLWGANYYASRLPVVSSWVVWDKRDGITSNDNADCELAWTNCGGPARVFRHLWNGMLKASEQGQRRVHPTQKPIALARWCFEKYGKPGDLIFDPFLGSGISVLAAEQLNDDRQVIGCELASAYIGVTIYRWSQLTGQSPQLLEG